MVIFTKNDRTSSLIESSDYTARYEEQIRTYQLKRIKDKYVIYELHRRRKPERKLSLPVKKFKNPQAVIAAVREDRIHLKVKNIESIRTNDGRLDIIQTNYLTKLKIHKKSSLYREDNRYLYPQMVCLVAVTDIKRQLSEHLLGYSRKLNPEYINDRIISRAEHECINMAIAKFCNIYGGVSDSSQIHVEIITKRFKFWKTIIRKRR